MNAKGAVEAALFSASGPLRVKDIAERTGLEEEKVKTLLERLADEYERRSSAIKVSKIGSDYVMMLRDEYMDYTDKFTTAELTPGMMKTLSAIAYNQPILQSELFKTLGSRVYDDVPVLVEKGLVGARKVGQTKELTTTKRFMEYFGVEATNKKDIRRWMDEQA